MSRARSVAAAVAVATTLLIAALPGRLVAQEPSAQDEIAAEVPAVTRIELSPDTLRLRVGETARIDLAAYDAEGAEVQPGQLVWWAGWENAQVDDLGAVTAINAGQTNAGVTVVGARDSAGEPLEDRIVLVVEPTDPAAIRVALPEGPLPAGSFVRLEPVALDARGNELWDRAVTLESSDPAAVEVAGHDLRFRMPGTATVHARVGGAVEELHVEVDPPLEGPLELEAAAGRAVTGESVRLSLTAGGREVSHPQWWVSPEGASIEVDHYFVAEAPGTYRVMAVFGDRSASTTIEVAPREVEGGWLKVGQIASPARTSDLWVFEGVDGRDYVYFGTFAAQMRAYDVTDPANPVFTDSILVDGRRVNDVKVNDDATVAVITLENDPSRNNGIVTLDLADPAHPKILAHFYDGLTGGIHNTYIVGDLVYAVNDGTRDVHIIDISDPANPKQVGRWGLDTTRKALHDVWVSDGLAYLSYWDDGLVILDVGKGIAGGTPTEPKMVSRINYPSGNTHVAWPWKNYVFLGDEIFPSRYSPDAPSDPRGFMHVIDISDPFHPREVGKYEVPEGGTHNFWVHDEILYIGYYQRGLRAIDISGGPLRGDLYRQGREIDYFMTETSDPEKAAGPDMVNRTNVWGAMWHKGHVFAIDTNSGLWIMKLDLPEEREVALD
ncbi:MAG: hypothetical protein L0206_10505 [Actinobacteria bacterium]|nr:hypothetical protein [Actinomycetota bacterium]